MMCTMLHLRPTATSYAADVSLERGPTAAQSWTDQDVERTYTRPSPAIDRQDDMHSIVRDSDHLVVGAVIGDRPSVEWVRVAVARCALGGRSMHSLQ